MFTSCKPYCFQICSLITHISALHTKAIYIYSLYIECYGMVSAKCCLKIVHWRGIYNNRCQIMNKMESTPLCLLKTSTLHSKHIFNILVTYVLSKPDKNINFKWQQPYFHDLHNYWQWFRLVTVELRELAENYLCNTGAWTIFLRSYTETISLLTNFFICCSV